MFGLSTPLTGLLLIAAGAGLHGLALWWRVSRGQAAVDAAAQALAAAAPGEGEGFVWRSIPPDCAEPKLVLAHERDGGHQVLQYPTLQPGNHVRFAGGAVRLMTVSALEQTLAADDGLRERLGLAPAEPRSAPGGPGPGPPGTRE